MNLTPKKLIPENEIQTTFARSSGAGGQNVNKTSTKVILHWRIGDSAVFNSMEKDRLRVRLANKINNNDEVVIMVEEERSQTQNREQAVARLQMLVADALKIPKKRRATKPTYSSKLKRLETKKQHSKVKANRRVSHTTLL